MIGRKFINLGSPVNRAAPLNRGLVSWWLQLPQNRGGAKLFDLCGKNHGTLTNGPTWGGALGRPGGWGALSFDGTDDNVNLDSSPSLSVTNAFTFAFWHRTSDTTSNSYLYGRDPTDGAQQHAIIRGYVDGSIEFFAQGYSGSDPRTGSGISIPDSGWHHYCYSYDGATWSGFRDGATVFSTALTFSLAQTTSSVRCRLMASAPGAADFANGQIDDFRIHNIALPGPLIYHASRQGYPNELNWIRRPYAVEAAAAPGGDAFPWHYYQQMQAMAG